ncbi:RNA-dependent DNA polymerase [Thalassomonas viridans]|uniref:RNA-dependent DNA polymerase n=1 Tax=Thalassomonas viridans TaxID=137584 RepID=A0AAF0C706_9GAMM|nr:reverse transcriptase domain-containing protein [Thalassomonas viridans]WDE04782.1 RNA-dependent DNA polymerase [Thalassomonas viridans]
MTVINKFQRQFSPQKLKKIYTEHIQLSGAIGIDNRNQKGFWPIQDDEINIISRKVISANYKFTKYKLKLISKGRGKPPREISIPTIRDRITLRALCDFLSSCFKSSIKFELPQDVVCAVKENVSSNTYDGFVKLDVTNFYPTIKHDELNSRLRKRIKEPKILELINNAISTPTVVRSHASDIPMSKGVPQGLAISNILSAIYLLNIDSYMKKQSNLRFYRYVDDVLILCEHKKAEEIAQSLIKRFKKIGLEIHDPIKVPDKSQIGHITEKFDFLGYEFDNGLISCRKGSVDKLRESIISIFNGYKYADKKNADFLLWRLDMRITGCIFENKCKGWLFYFSEMNNESLLHQLDAFVTNLTKRFNAKIKPKKFVRSHYEIKHHRNETKYIPNFDSYSLEQMQDVLNKYFNMDLSKLTENEIEYEFKKRIKRQAKDLLQDVQDFS